MRIVRPSCLLHWKRKESSEAAVTAADARRGGDLLYGGGMIVCAMAAGLSRKASAPGLYQICCSGSWRSTNLVIIAHALFLISPTLDSVITNITRETDGRQGWHVVTLTWTDCSPLLPGFGFSIYLPVIASKTEIYRIIPRGKMKTWRFLESPKRRIHLPSCLEAHTVLSSRVLLYAVSDYILRDFVWDSIEDLGYFLWGTGDSTIYLRCWIY